MPRKPREFEIGGIYHIVNRGVEKRTIFLKKQDYSRFILGLEFFNNENPIDLWALITPKQNGELKGGTVPPKQVGERIAQERKKKRKQIVEILAFALMPNHYHLIMREIIPGGISLFMRKMGGYSMYFNKQYERIGPLFQSRYKVVPIKTDIQLGVVFVYVHTNPIELKEPLWKDLKVRDLRQALRWLEEYQWSSYHDYTGKLVFPYVTHRSFFTDFYGGEVQCREAVEDWIKFKARNTNLGPEIIE